MKTVIRIPKGRIKEARKSYSVYKKGNRYFGRPKLVRAPRGFKF